MVGALGIVTLLYAAIGTLRIRRGHVVASDYARTHVGFLLACLALGIAWGAHLDLAEVIGGWHGTVDQASLTIRAPGSAVVVAVAVITAVISIAWAWRDRPTLIIAGWTALVVSLTAGYFVIPGVVRASAGPASGEWGSELARRRLHLERVAFDLTELDGRAPPAFASGEAALRTMPLWDPAHVGRVVGAAAHAVALRAPHPRDGRGASDAGAAWLIAPTAAGEGARLALETDTGLVVTSLPTADANELFGPGFEGPLVTAPDSAPPIHGVPITGLWRRLAIAWTIQSWDLLRGESKGQELLWRRDVTDRLERLAPFAQFGVPRPTLRDGALWWVSWGYVTHETFPLVRPLPWRDGNVRYFRAGLVGAVRAGTGETHLWLAPGYDSLTASWARRPWNSSASPIGSTPRGVSFGRRAGDAGSRAPERHPRRPRQRRGAAGRALRPRARSDHRGPRVLPRVGAPDARRDDRPRRLVDRYRQAEPDRHVPDDVYAWLDLWHGSCRDAAILDGPDDPRAVAATFTISAPYSRWKSVLKKELDPVKGMMQGVIKVRGDLPTIVRYVKAANVLVDLTTEVPTEFPDE